MDHPKYCGRCGKPMVDGQKFCCPKQCLHCGEVLPLGARRDYCDKNCWQRKRRSRDPKNNICHACGKRTRGRGQRYCWFCAPRIEKIRATRERMKKPIALPGEPVIWNGYVMVWDPQHPRSRYGRIGEHIIVMEKSIGRFLKPTESVVHKDCDFSNNAPDNLLLLPTKRVAADLRRAMLNEVAQFIKQRNLVPEWLEHIKHVFERS